ncbi:uncharacterized protein LY89DRAFT_682794 [Mollisia scopiformis]|uniref:Uncharacterized protein n=1 Tax=Mollisia scopiformis TaxID=149040 RepID=A0A194XIL8_MOLSC|nr:uncharacterized protein LY89DRAFT_682794 [Mollisia scopiformis]KUJ19976.1 hypothetical protein LY89DRAFT_682794 [Mollisia scopiformis]
MSEMKYGNIPTNFKAQPENRQYENIELVKQPTQYRNRTNMTTNPPLHAPPRPASSIYSEQLVMKPWIRNNGPNGTLSYAIDQTIENVQGYSGPPLNRAHSITTLVPPIVPDTYAHHDQESIYEPADERPEWEFPSDASSHHGNTEQDEFERSMNRAKAMDFLEGGEGNVSHRRAATDQEYIPQRLQPGEQGRSTAPPEESRLGSIQGLRKIRN